jgi:hypothetical protein
LDASKRSSVIIDHGVITGEWGVRAFDNEDANDWAYGLEGTSDISLILSAFARVDESEQYLEAPIASDAAKAMAARCDEVIRLRARR